MNDGVTAMVITRYIYKILTLGDEDDNNEILHPIRLMPMHAPNSGSDVAKRQFWLSLANITHFCVTMNHFNRELHT